MVRAGVVSHPIMWPFSGYNQIQAPRRKNVLIDYERLQTLLGLSCYDEVKSCHKKWVEKYLEDSPGACQEEWTRSIAVGSRSFVEHVKELMGFRARGRQAAEAAQGYQLREPLPGYGGLFDIKKDDMGPENTFSWKINNE